VHEWIADFIAGGGYLAVVALMVLENVFPPIPSEIVMPLAGYEAARGALRLPLVVAAGAAGSALGAIPWYLAGRWLGERRVERWARRHGRWLTLRPRDVATAQAWFRRHCGKAVLLGRLIPAVRTLISVPAGITRMSPGRFLAYSLLGSALWSGALAAAGHALGERHELVARWLGPATNGILGVILLVYLYRVVRWSPER
jgi:membrane protein DedA with SNARE-associated domain